MSFQKVFQKYVDQNQKGIFSLLDIKALFEKSSDFETSSLQRSDLFRTLSLCRQISFFVIDDDGDLILDKLDYCIEKAKESSFILWDNNESDSLFIDHLVKVLQKMSHDKALFKRFKKISTHLCHEKAREIIRQTLLLKKGAKVEKAEIKRAIFCTLICFLRQSVGSCFASACAIYSQSDQIAIVLKDLEDLLSTGSLKRTISGVEYLVPFNPRIGMGDLKKALKPNTFLPQNLTHFLKSPSIIQAFEKVCIIEGDFLEKEKRLKELILSVTTKKQIFNLYDLIDELLLKYYELKPEDFAAKKRLEKTERFIGSSYHPQLMQTAVTPKKHKINEYLENKKIILDHIRNEVECPLLKAWEFTIASLCDVKREFTRWNLYTSLGMNHEERGGIGEFIYHEVDARLKKLNEELVSSYNEAIEIEKRIHTTESKLHRADAQLEESRLRSELNSLTFRMQAALENKDRIEVRAEGFQKLFSYLINTYLELFNEYFQEVYDPELLEFPTSDYNDSPAGFHLIFTYGRKDPSNWTFIEDKEEFIQALRDFFIATETRVVSSFYLFEMHSEISLLITELIQFLLSPSFIENALTKVQKSHSGFISHLEEKFKEKIIQKPWAYISGGTIETLAKTYFKKDTLTKIEKRVSSAEELFIFLIETIRDSEPKLKQEIIEDNLKFLLYSENHACLLSPYFPAFKKTWYSEETPQSILQSGLYSLAEEFILKISLSTETQKNLLKQYLSSYSKIEQKTILSAYIPGHLLSVREFHEHTVFSIKVNPAAFSAFLYSVLLSNQSQNLEALDSLFEHLPFDTKKRSEDAKRLFLEKKPQTIFNALVFQEELKKSIIEAHESVCMPYNYHEAIILALEQLKWIFPRPILFADTNWPCYYFGFIPNPVNLELELWRFDPLGIKGHPMGKDYIFPECQWGVVLEKLIYEK